LQKNTEKFVFLQGFSEKVVITLIELRKLLL